MCPVLAFAAGRTKLQTTQLQTQERGLPATDALLLGRPALAIGGRRKGTDSPPSLTPETPAWLT